MSTEQTSRTRCDRCGQTIRHAPGIAPRHCEGCRAVVKRRRTQRRWR